MNTIIFQYKNVLWFNGLMVYFIYNRHWGLKVVASETIKQFSHKVFPAIQKPHDHKRLTSSQKRNLCQHKQDVR